tara:strand:- start:3835 stop:4254 length:420 start_codon:yes stop_codon:yes gene_type:complete
MKYFAILDSENNVLNTIVVDDEACSTDEAVEGEIYCQNLLGPGTYKQFSMTGDFRERPAYKLGTFDSDKNAFIDEQPFASWTLDGSNEWVAPIPQPDVHEYNNENIGTHWDEDNRRWLGTTENGTNLVWDHNSSTWNLA